MVVQKFDEENNITFYIKTTNILHLIPEIHYSLMIEENWCEEIRNSQRVKIKEIKENLKKIEDD